MRMTMKKKILIALLGVFSVALAGTVTDKDGYKYKTVKIGKQVWMAEDYRFETKFSKCADYRGGADPDDCIRVYDFLATVQSGHKGCPTGWGLATVKDWVDLVGFVLSDFPSAKDATEKQIRKMHQELGSRLRSTSCKDGKNSVGFNASCLFDNVSSVYYGAVSGGQNPKVGETVFECAEINGQGVFSNCPEGGWQVFLRIRCIEE
mgnify:FL=1